MNTHFSVYIAAVKQNYESQVHDEFVIRGNTGVLKCQIPNFVEEFITVTSWLRDETITIISDLNESEYYYSLLYIPLRR